MGVIESELLGAVSKVAGYLAPVDAGSLLGEFHPLDAGFVQDADWQQRLNAFMLDDLQDHCFAVVDLSDPTSPPRYAGHLDRDDVFPASLGKVLPLYAAYRLRADVRLVASQFAAEDLASIANRVRDEYRRVGGSTATRPMIEDLFELTAGGTIDFAFTQKLDDDGNVRRQTDAELDAEHVAIGARTARCTRPDGTDKQGHPKFRSKLYDDAVVRAELATLAAHDQLRLMGGWSDNTAAGMIIQALGFDFLWAVSKRAGLHRSWPDLVYPKRPAVRSGLVIMADYCWGGWRPRAPDAPRGLGRTCNARSLAAMMALLAQGKLVDLESSLEMREIMRKTTDFGAPQPHSTWSPIGRGLFENDLKATQNAWAYGSAPPPDDSDITVSKVGYLTGDTNMCDAIIYRGPLPNGRRVCFVLIGLMTKQRTVGNTPVTSTLMKNFGVAMALQILNRYARL